MTSLAQENSAAAGAKHRAVSAGDVFAQLHEQCTNVVASSVQEGNGGLLGQSYVFAGDLDGWYSALADQPHATLVRTASEEYVLSMLNVCQGQYRNGFKGLRLVLELCLQSVYLSADLVTQQEWLSGEKHTNWTALMNADNGPLGVRFCRAFFPELLGDVGHFRTLAGTLYTELSECIHGNVPNHIPLPNGLTFSQATFELWNAKAKVVRLVVHFTFALRHLRSLRGSPKASLEAALTEQLGHIEAIRTEAILHA